ncbi:cellulose binding domain-containing protein [Plantactinospora sp. B5E13]|uniref:cellulose binding domain-containing protein n=1 Tax=unclassified Plantactinospora TaxID=2631981 RepID=UPI00325C4FB9
MSAPQTPRWRLFAAAPWIVVSAGVLVMIVLLVAATGYLTGDRRPASAPEPVFPFVPGNTPTPEVTAEASADLTPSTGPASRSPVATARPTGAGATPSRTGAPRPTTPAGRPVTTSSPPAGPPPQQSELTANYRVTNDWRNLFMAEVRIRNQASSARPWAVELRFPSGVGRLRAFWVDGAPQPMLRRSGESYVFTGTQSAPAGGTVPLRVQFEHDGRTTRPTVCTVNGAACSIS